MKPRDVDAPHRIREGTPPFLAGCMRRIYAAVFSFWAGVMPPMRMFGRSLLSRSNDG